MVIELPPKKPLLALIGAIGSGKSQVAREFAKLGAAVISGDQIGHEALRQPAIRAQVIERFGAEIADFDGEIDRRKLGAIVFANTEKLRELEKIVFPWIEQGIEKEVAAAQGDAVDRLIVVDAAVILEAGWNKLDAKIVYVDAAREQRLARLAAQRGWTEQEVQARSLAQFTLTDKVSRADAAIDNSGPPDALAPQIARLLSEWRIPVAFGRGFGENT